MNPIAQGSPLLLMASNVWRYVILTVAWRPLANTYNCTYNRWGGMSATAELLFRYKRRRRCSCVVIDILRTGDEMGRDVAGVARTLRGVPVWDFGESFPRSRDVRGPVRGVPGGLPNRPTPQSPPGPCLHRGALRRRMSSVLRRANQLHPASSLYHGGPPSLPDLLSQRVWS